MPQILPLTANTYLLDTPQGPLLVDAGMTFETNRLLRWLRDQPPIALLLTHHHLDHAGGAARILREFSLPVHAHPLDIPFLTGAQRRPPLPLPLLGSYLANAVPAIPPSALHPLEEGQSLLGWEVVHLPGHTPGQIGLLRNGELIAADALRGGRNGPALPAPMINANHAQARQTLGKLAQMSFTRMYVGHGPSTGFTHEQVVDLAHREGVL